MASTGNPARNIREEVGMPMPDNVTLRCSTIVLRGSSVLLVHRTTRGPGDWVLPGGTPRPGESMAACARRELREETGLAVEPTRIAFVLEAVGPDGQARTVDLVFAADHAAHGQHLHGGEPGTVPEFVPFSRLRELDLRPPLAGHLPGYFHRGAKRYAPYLGNLWRPTPASRAGQEAAELAMTAVLTPEAD
jgi:8-oxo-dGTP diphosphatase